MRNWPTNSEDRFHWKTWRSLMACSVQILCSWWAIIWREGQRKPFMKTHISRSSCVWKAPWRVGAKMSTSGLQPTGWGEIPVYYLFKTMCILCETDWYTTGHGLASHITKLKRTVIDKNKLWLECPTSFNFLTCILICTSCLDDFRDRKSQLPLSQY